MKHHTVTGVVQDEAIGWARPAAALLLMVLVAALAGALASPARAVFPGENGRIVYVSNQDGNFDIYSTNADGTGRTRLTTDAAFDTEPAFSPDGAKIAFTSDRSGNRDVYVMNADGTNQTRLTTDVTFDGSPTFSPDGTKIAFMSDRGSSRDVYIMDADGTNQTRLTSDAASDSEPAFSPDGTKIAFTSTRDGGSRQIYTMNADGTNQTRLVSDTSNGFEPAFSPDGTKIVFTTFLGSDAGLQEVFLINADGTNRINLSNNASNDGNPTFSPDGKSILFSSDRSGDNELYTMNLDGTGQTRLTNDPSNDSRPDWQPLNPDLSVLASDRPDPVVVGQEFTYSFAVANNGRSGANSVVLTDRLPAGVEFVSASVGCSNTAGTVRCGLGDLARGASATVEVTVRPTAEGTITNTVTVASSARDADPTDNSDREATRVTAPPATPTITSPADGSRDADGFFVVRGTAAPGSPVRLFEGTTRVGTDEADLATGAWRIAVGEAAEGSHTYAAKTIDTAGNASGWSNSLTVIVDSTRPSVVVTSPTGGATGVAPRTNVTATFSEAMDEESIEESGVFKLVKKGASSPVAATVSYDPATKKTTLNPSSNLARGTRYTATVTTGTKDLAGNAPAANKTWTFTVRR